jgi:predicted dehydrogenase
MMNLGIIGCGSIVKSVHAPIIENIDRVNVRFVADVNIEQLTNYYFKSEEKINLDGELDLPEIDIALLAIPVGYRSDYYSYLNKQQIPTFAEKPFSVNYDLHADIIKSNQYFANYMRLCYSSTRIMKSIIEHNTFGPVKMVRVYEEGKVAGTGLEQDHYQNDVQAGGDGIIHERGCHLFSQLHFIFKDFEFNLIDLNKHIFDNLTTSFEADFIMENGDKNIPLHVSMSRTEDIGNQIIILFENSILTFDQTNPSDKIKIFEYKSDVGEKLRELKRIIDIYDKLNYLCHIENKRKFATDSKQAFKMRWYEFLAFVSGELSYKDTLLSGPQVTKTLEELSSYE